MKDIRLIGSGGHSFAVIELLRSLGTYNLLGIIDKDPKTNEVLGIPVSKDESLLDDNSVLSICIGDNGVRKRLSQQFKADFPTLIHQSAVVFPSSTIGVGSQILPNAVIDADVTLGDFCIVNNNATVSHNVQAGNYVHIAINAAIAGGVTIGEGTLVGAGSVINPEIKVGSWVTIGAGAVVTKDVPDNAVVYGNPAKIKRYNANR